MDETTIDGAPADETPAEEDEVPVVETPDVEDEPETPDPTEVPTIDIEEEDVPLSDAEKILEDLLGEEEEIGDKYAEIVEVDVPMGEAPEKEGGLSKGLMIAGFSLLWLIILLIIARMIYKKVTEKKEEEEAKKED